MDERGHRLSLKDRMITDEYQQFLILQNALVESWRAGLAIKSKVFDSRGRVLVSIHNAMTLKELIEKNNISYDEFSSDFQRAAEYFGIQADFGGGVTSNDSNQDTTLFVVRDSSGHIISEDSQTAERSSSSGSILNAVKNFFKK